MQPSVNYNESPAHTQVSLDTAFSPKMKECLLAYPHLLKAEQCRRSFLFFHREFWECIVQEDYTHNWHIEYLCQELQTMVERIIAGKPKKHDMVINIPPGTTKSLTVSVMLPAWFWVLKASARIISGSYSGELSLEHAELSRDLVRSDKFQLYFPEIELRKDKDAKSNYKNTEGGARLSTSTGGTITGFHGHLILVDDPLNPKKAASEKELENATNWMDRTLSTRKVDKEIVPTILIMQRLHEKDPTGHMLGKKKAGKPVKHICLPGSTEYPVKPAYLKKRYKKGLLDPNRLNKAVLKDMKLDLGIYGYSGQVGQDPKPAEGGMFSREDFGIVQMLPPGCTRLRWWDLAATKQAANSDPDWTVGALVAMDRYKKFYIADIRRVRKNPGSIEKLVRQTAKLDAMIDNDYGEQQCKQWMEQEPGSSGKNTIFNYQSRVLAGFAFHGETSTGDKTAYADPFSAYVEAGMVYLVEGSWNDLFLQEAEMFPLASHDDQVDAVSKGFNKLFGKRKRAGVLGGAR